MRMRVSHEVICLWMNCRPPQSPCSPRSLRRSSSLASASWIFSSRCCCQTWFHCDLDSCLQSPCSQDSDSRDCSPPDHRSDHSPAAVAAVAVVVAVVVLGWPDWPGQVVEDIVEELAELVEEPPSGVETTILLSRS